jgi:hypothetical protein
MITFLLAAILAVMLLSFRSVRTALGIITLVILIAVLCSRPPSDDHAAPIEAPAERAIEVAPPAASPALIPEASEPKRDVPARRFIQQ